MAISVCVLMLQLILHAYDRQHFLVTGRPDYLNPRFFPDVPLNIRPEIREQFGGHMYAIFRPRNIWWHTAQSICQNMNGQLAIPNSKEEYEFLLQLVRKLYVRLSMPERHETWGFHTGIRSLEGNWIPNDYINWCVGEPKNHGSCGEISTAHGFCVNDYKCHENRKRGFICQLPVYEVDQPERAFDQRVICMQPRNYSREKSSWFDSELACRELGMRLTLGCNSKRIPNRLMSRRAITAFDMTLLDGYWSGDPQPKWCDGHPLPNRACSVVLGGCYRSISCSEKVIQRFCCSIPVLI